MNICRNLGGGTHTARTNGSFSVGNGITWIGLGGGASPCPPRFKP